jgi:exodeoxyribonuclease VIII
MTLQNITDYHRDTRYASKSALDILDRSPWEYWLKKVLPYTPGGPEQIDRIVPHHVRLEWADQDKKRHFVVGDALDRLLLEPEKFQTDFYVGTAHSRATNAGKAEAAQLHASNPGKRWISPDEKRDIFAMRDAILASPWASLVTGRNGAQQTVTWTDPGTGILCKCRPDFRTLLDTSPPKAGQEDTRLRNHQGQVVDELVCDLKTIDGLSKWPAHVEDFNYDKQDAFYLDGCNQAEIEQIEQQASGHDWLSGDFTRRPLVRMFLFLIVDTEWPHPTMVRTLPPDAEAIGRMKYQRSLETLARCRQTNTWPQAAGDWSETAMPAWYFHKHRNTI